VLGRAQPVLGTAMLGSVFGVITRATLVRNGKREEILNDAGELMVLLITNPGWTLQLECLFDVGVEPPGLLETITLPYVGLTGRVMEGVTVAWEGGGAERVLSIPAAQWDSMELAAAYRLDDEGDLYAIGAALSLLATMNPRSIINLNYIGVVDFVGGGATKLDGQTTTDVVLNVMAELHLSLGGVWQTKSFRLVALATAATMTEGDAAENTDPTAGTIIIHPDDRHASTNDKVWIEIA